MQPTCGRGSRCTARATAVRRRVLPRSAHRRSEICDASVADTRKARILLKDATYMRAWQPLHGTRNRRPPTGAAAFSAQDFLIGVAEGKSAAMLPVPVPARKRRVLIGRAR